MKATKKILLKPDFARLRLSALRRGELQAVLESFSTTRRLPDKHVLHIVESIGEQLGRVLERQRGKSNSDRR